MPLGSTRDDVSRADLEARLARLEQTVRHLERARPTIRQRQDYATIVSIPTADFASSPAALTVWKYSESAAKWQSISYDFENGVHSVAIFDGAWCLVLANASGTVTAALPGPVDHAALAALTEDTYFWNGTALEAGYERSAVLLRSAAGWRFIAPEMPSTGFRRDQEASGVDAAFTWGRDGGTVGAAFRLLPDYISADLTGISVPMGWGDLDGAAIAISNDDYPTATYKLAEAGDETDHTIALCESYSASGESVLLLRGTPRIRATLRVAGASGDSHQLFRLGTTPGELTTSGSGAPVAVGYYFGSTWMPYWLGWPNAAMAAEGLDGQPVEIGTPVTGQGIVWDGSKYVNGSIYFDRINGSYTVATDTSTTGGSTIGIAAAASPGGFEITHRAMADHNAKWLNGVLVDAASPTLGFTLKFDGTKWIAAAAGGNATQIQGRDVLSAAPATDNALVWNGTAWAPGLADAKELQGRAVSAAAPSTGHLLRWDGSAWTPSGTAQATSNVVSSGGYTASVALFASTSGSADVALRLYGDVYSGHSTVDRIHAYVYTGASVRTASLEIGRPDASNGVKFYIDDNADSKAKIAVEGSGLIMEESTTFLYGNDDLILSSGQYVKILVNGYTLSIAPGFANRFMLPRTIQYKDWSGNNQSIVVLAV
jgi:hypothetical protein